MPLHKKEQMKKSDIVMRKKDIFLFCLVFLRLGRGRDVVLAEELVVDSGQNSLAYRGLNFGAVSGNFNFAIPIERVAKVLGVKEGQFLDANPLDFERSTRHEFTRDR